MQFFTRGNILHITSIKFQTKQNSDLRWEVGVPLGTLKLIHTYVYLIRLNKNSEPKTMHFQPLVFRQTYCCPSLVWLQKTITHPYPSFSYILKFYLPVILNLRPVDYRHFFSVAHPQALLE